MIKHTYRLPPKYDFKGAPLKDVYDYHLSLRSQRMQDPTLFVVAQDQDYEKNGVLLVNLDTDLRCSVETCRIKASDALLAAMNIQIANMDWQDFKEVELPLPAGSAVASESASKGVSGSDSESGSHGSSAAPSNQARSQRQAQPSSTPHRIFGVYGTAGANMTVIGDLLEPGWRDKALDAVQYAIQGSYTESPDPWNEVIKRHPWACLRNKKMHRQWFICADETDFKEKGVLLVYMDWDENIDRDSKDLLNIGPNVDVTTERCAAENAIARLTTLVSGET